MLNIVTETEKYDGYFKTETGIIITALNHPQFPYSTEPNHTISNVTTDLEYHSRIVLNNVYVKEICIARFTISKDVNLWAYSSNFNSFCLEW